VKENYVGLNTDLLELDDPFFYMLEVNRIEAGEIVLREGQREYLVSQRLRQQA
jgi:hypothetical protein